MSEQLTIKEFLTTAVAVEAANYSGNSSIHSFVPDSDGRIGVTMSGSYTVEEMRAKLADLEHIQHAFNVASVESAPEVVNVRCMRRFCVIDTLGKPRIAERDYRSKAAAREKCATLQAPGVVHGRYVVTFQEC